jgi:adenylate cyclase
MPAASLQFGYGLSAKSRAKSGMRTGAVMGLDISEYSLHMAKSESTVHARVGRAMREARNLLVKDGGRVFSFSGDGFMAEFPTSEQAFQCALRMQYAVFSAKFEKRTRKNFLKARIGLHEGAFLEIDGLVGGRAVNLAARLEQMATPGTIFLSQIVYDQVKNDPYARFTPIGTLRLKHISAPIAVYVAELRHGKEMAHFNSATHTIHIAAPSTPNVSRSHNSDKSATLEKLPTSTTAQHRAVNRFLDSPAPRNAEPVVAVLPFWRPRHLKIPNHICEGLSYDIISQLGCLKELKVIAYGTTSRFHREQQSISNFAQQLKADYVFDGHFSTHDGAIQLRAELVETSTLTAIATLSKRFPNPPIFEVQDTVVAEIVHAVLPRVREAELLRIRGQRTEDLSAYELTLIARQKLALLDRASLSEAKTVIDQAIAKDPLYAEALALAADWHGLQISQGISTDRGYDHLQSVRLGLEALKRDPANIRALTRYAHRKALLDRDFTAATSLFTKALRQAPNSANTVMWSSHTYSYAGEYDLAISQALRAIELSPNDIEAHYFFGALCMAYYSAGRYEEASDAGLRAVSEPRPSRSFRQLTAAALAAAGRFSEARQVAQSIISFDASYSVHRAVEAMPHKDPDVSRKYKVHLLAAGLPLRRSQKET